MGCNLCSPFGHLAPLTTANFSKSFLCPESEPCVVPSGMGLPSGKVFGQIPKHLGFTGLFDSFFNFRNQHFFVISISEFPVALSASANRLIQALFQSWLLLLCRGPIETTPEFDHLGLVTVGRKDASLRLLSAGKVLFHLLKIVSGDFAPRIPFFRMSRGVSKGCFSSTCGPLGDSEDRCPARPASA